MAPSSFAKRTAGDTRGRRGLRPSLAHGSKAPFRLYVCRGLLNHTPPLVGKGGPSVHWHAQRKWPCFLSQVLKGAKKATLSAGAPIVPGMGMSERCVKWGSCSIVWSDARNEGAPLV